MKKFIICACCLFLSGASAQAMSFINNTQQTSKAINAQAVVSMNATLTDVIPPGKSASRIEVAVYGVQWHATDKTVLATCQGIPPTGYSLQSRTTFTLRAGNDRYSCLVVPG